jgi:hypothetical protein
MSASQYALNIGLLVFVLGLNLGVREVTARRLALPVVVAAGLGYVFLRSVPTLGNDVTLEIAGVACGLVLGALAAACVRIGRDARTGALTMRAGTAYALVWTAVIGGRIAFAYGAEHTFAPQIARFSMAHQITGAEAWTAAFVLMALAMVGSRVLVNGAQLLWASRATRIAVA